MAEDEFGAWVKDNNRAVMARFVLSTDDGIEAIDQTVRDLLGTLVDLEQGTWYGNSDLGIRRSRLTSKIVIATD